MGVQLPSQKQPFRNFSRMGDVPRELLHLEILTGCSGDRFVNQGLVFWESLQIGSGCQGEAVPSTAHLPMQPPCLVFLCTNPFWHRPLKNPLLQQHAVEQHRWKTRVQPHGGRAVAHG